jgi:hypothetical protein
LGLFDFFRRKPPPAEEGPSPDYVLAHYALRSMALSDPLRFLSLVASEDAGTFLEAVWQDVAKRCGRPPSFPAAAIRVHPVRVNHFPCAILEFPPPREPPNAYLVALLLPADVTEGNAASVDLAGVQGRYFALEKGDDLAGGVVTFLTEWQGTKHSNYGPGPAPAVEAFATAIRDLL